MRISDWSSDVCSSDLNFIRHHVLSGRVSANDPELQGLSCVPFMVSLEIMAEACALLAGSPVVCLIENVRAFDWIALDDGEITLERSEERRVGKECGSTCRSRWSPYN